MSVEQETYIGAYIKIGKEITTNYKIEKKCLLHHENKYSKEASFCDICGSKLIDSKIPVEQEINYYDLFETIEEEEKYEDTLVLISSEYINDILLIGNDIHEDEDEDYIAYDTHGEFEITPKMIIQCIKNFKQNYKEIITFLKSKVETLEIKFGAIIYYN